MLFHYGRHVFTIARGLEMVHRAIDANRVSIQIDGLSASLDKNSKVNLLGIMGIYYGKNKKPNASHRIEINGALFEGLEHIDDFCKMMDISDIKYQVERVRSVAEVYSGQDSIENLDKFKEPLDELINRIGDRLKSEYFLHVSPRMAQYYTPSIFGQDVLDKFHVAADDIEGAGRCLALGEGTACVLHLMRVMEAGLKALAKALGISYAPSWESYLKQISVKIDGKHKTKGVRWKRDEAFFRDVSGDILTVKQAWRNPTMHVGRKYSPDEAEEIYRSVRSFMTRLASRLSQVS
jgi:hypothetical protein